MDPGIWVWLMNPVYVQQFPLIKKIILDLSLNNVITERFVEAEILELMPFQTFSLNKYLTEIMNNV